MCLSPDECGGEYAYSDETITWGDCPIPDDGEECDNENYFCYAGSAYSSSESTQCVATTNVESGAVAYECGDGSLCGTQDDDNCYECLDGSGE